MTFYYRASQAGVFFDVDLYAGPDENRETYLYTIEATEESVKDWVMMELRWEDFHRASWEENPDAVFAKADQVSGMAFGIGTPPDAPNVSTVWVDDLSLLGTSTTTGSHATEKSAPEQPTPVEKAQKALPPLRRRAHPADVGHPGIVA